MERLQAIVHGRVQGVGYRYYVLQTARELNLVGWVRNLPDKTVEVVAEGNRRQLDLLLIALHKGPIAAKVSRVASIWLAPTHTFTSFEVQY